MSPVASLATLLSAAAWPLEGQSADFDSIVELVGNARFVLIGEASHGTHEFYRVRAQITKRLIEELGFCAVAAEADWPDAGRVDRYVRGRGNDRDASQALEGFQRFPQWMWRNADVLDFVGWMRNWNEQHMGRRQIGFYGLDLYSLQRSMDAVLEYLRVVDPPAARRALQRYSCFEHTGDDPQLYGRAASFGLTPSCESAVIEQLVELQRKSEEYLRRDGRLEPGQHFFAEQNARLVVNAEAYYRSMFAGRAISWNVRDTHMSEMLEALDAQLSRDLGHPARIVIWAHNSHLGDARTTEMSKRGELNLGQLVREKHARETVSIGFCTYAGSVTAARDWDEPAERMRVNEAIPGSWEHLLHGLDAGNVFVDLRNASLRAVSQHSSLLERAIGVIYRPATERASHYFYADLPRQFDAVLHYDVTRAVEPLEPSTLWTRGEWPETYPSAL